MSRCALIADDDSLSREFLAEALRAAGYSVDEAVTGENARALFDGDRHDMVLTDFRMPGRDGLSLLEDIKQRSPDTPVVLVTAFGSVETAVRAMRSGAEDFITKPISIEQLDLVLRRLDERRSLLRENRALKTVLADSGAEADDFVGTSPAWLNCIETARRVARTRATVLIRGESGSGKEVVASFLHRESDRRDRAFIKTNCAVLQDSLLTSELFGHERGAFTNAYAKKEGRFELADGGTLFLDEIGETSPEVQAKLLRVIETGEFERVGGKETLRVDVRVVCATNRDLEEMMQQGSFREDLFYRLNVVPIVVPPLRERGDDAVRLARHFLARYAREYGSEARTFSAEAERKIPGYGWPGNVRELANAVQRTVLLGNDEIIEADALGLPGHSDPTLPEGSVGQTIAEMERRLILGTLRVTGGNKTEAARILGVTSRTLSNKLRLYRERGLLSQSDLLCAARGGPPRPTLASR